MSALYIPSARAAVLHVSGLDKAGKDVRWICVFGPDVKIETNRGESVLKMDVGSITAARLENVQTGGLFKKTVPGLVIDFVADTGENRSLVLQLTEKTNISALAVLGCINRSREDAKTTVEEYKVKGVSFFEDAFFSLADENDDWNLSKKEAEEDGLEDEPIHKHEYSPYKVLLVPEDDNEADPNAVAVIVDGEKIGYIPKGSTKHVRELLSRDDLKIEAKMGGGPYKVLEENEDGRLDWRTGESQIWAKVSIRYKKDAEA